ncbi:MAG TPA: helix-turn-helix domain-containing protein [Bryobacteraceae bacterium]|jgi:DNA-binding transcriptional ArsR family regulator|nr:helix-turn-helix domain-containing protein [Bryobacteraceae bacterium]
MAAAIQVIQSGTTAATLFSPARMQILESLAEPASAAGIARTLGLPRQQVNYHLRELETAGLVELVEERRKGNCFERVLRAAARSYVISPEALGTLGKPGATEEQQRDRFSVGYLVALAARAIRDLAVLSSRAEKAGKRISTMAMEVDVRFTSPAARSEFAGELAQEIARLAAKYHNESAPGGRRFRLVCGVYPAIASNETADATSVRMQ